ncbi:glycosyltransferase [Paenibacillus sp. P96]|uniref:Glycosyltransferase n=1 Tax=Paenibacillus zeirhizosphaerae TaxID=2987519 RepID=A0ABT9FXB6_9BACL|nr:TPR domain-containing glycosyltransferase [Paenibacillus sp. P96]MDP4099370.1 glycosyltransferase [Paenibacillus sp. P96]
MDQPSISLCMIVKNEAEYLPKCLSSVMRIVDEIIIVDTGSTDDTVAIAKAFGAKVIQMPWQDSFSDARNRGFEEATGDWILWLDADEEMDVDEADKLKDLLTRDAVREQRIEGLQFVFCNHLEGGGVEYNRLHRMVRNRPEYRFEGRVHEQILPSMVEARPDVQLGQVDIHIHHHGYLARNIIRQDKIERNISLLRQAISEHPDFPHYPYYLAIELYRINDLEGALSNLNRALEHMVQVPKQILSSAHKYRLIVLDAMKRYSDLVRLSRDSITEFPDFPDLYHLEAIGWNQLGATDKAISSLRQALSVGPAGEEYPTVAGHGTYLTCRDLALLYESIGNPLGADLYFTLVSLMVSHAGIRFQEPWNAESKN